jgi:PAS domain S-box-containing protein
VAMQKILIVNADEVTAKTLKVLLDSFNYDVETVLDLKELSSKCEVEAPDLILIDLKSKAKKNIVDVANEICRDKSIPVIFMSDMYQYDDIIDSIIRESSYGYITKPININHLNVMVKMILERHKFILESKKNEKRLQLATQILELLNHSDSAEETISDILFIIKNMTGYSAVAFRIFLDDKLEYFDSIGYDDSFINVKNYLKNEKFKFDVRCSDCFINQVLENKIDSNKSFFTVYGSFWTNNLSRLIETEFGAKEVKVKCKDYGYKSVAIIPIKSREKIIGVMHIGDKKENMFDKETILFFERVGLSIGITLERQKAYFDIQKAYEKSNLLESIINKSSVVTIRWQKKSKWAITFISDSIQKYGYSPKEFYSGNLEYKNIVHPDDLKEIIPKVIKFIEGGDLSNRVTYRVLTKDGHVRWVEDFTWKELDENGDVIYLQGLISDITEKHLVFKRVEENEIFLNTILEGINAGIIIIEPDSFKVVNVNKRAEIILERNQEEIINKNTSDVLFEHNCLEDDKGSNEEIIIKTPSGKLKPVSKTVIRTNWKGKEHIVIIIFDITKQKDLERQLRYAQKMESVGFLASGIAHEINTPIQYVGDNINFVKNGFNDLLQCLKLYDDLKEILKSRNLLNEKLEEIEELEENIDIEFLFDEIPVALEQSIDGVNKVAKIVSAMKKFAHPSKDEKTMADINNIIENTITISKNVWKYVAEVEFKPNPDLPFVPCNIGDISQVILNIIVNAAHAIEDVVKDSGNKGKIKIVTDSDNDFVRISISDTGTGIPDDIKEKIFDPFFTTKEVGKGTGQGLSLVHTIVRDNHKGKIEVESKVGEGTTFNIFLPLGGDV